MKEKGGQPQGRRRRCKRGVRGVRNEKGEPQRGHQSGGKGLLRGRGREREREGEGGRRSNRVALVASKLRDRLSIVEVDQLYTVPSNYVSSTILKTQL